MSHPVVWFEVLGKKAGELQRFYGDLFGWKLKVDGGPLAYGSLAPGEGPGIGGGIGQAAAGFSEGVRFYVSADDLEATLKRGEKLGGKRIMPPTQIPNGPSVAMLADPEGHVVGLVKMA